MNTLDSTENQINVILVTNPFDIEGSRKIYTYEYQSGNRARYYIQKALLSYNPVINSELNIVVGVNGEIIDYEDNWYIYPKDTITICPVIQGGGGGGGNKALRTVASLAVLAASIWVGVGPGAALLGITSATGAAIAGAAVGIVGNLLVNALFPTAMPSIDGLGSLGDWGQASPTYGWTVTDNPARESSPLPELFGRTLCTPPIISKHITTTGDKQYLNILLALCQGPITDIEEIYINDTAISNFKDVGYDTRNGAANNILIEYFNDTYVEQPVNFKLINESANLNEIDVADEVLLNQWVSFTTLPNTKSVAIDIQYPTGIYKKTTRQVPIYSSNSSNDTKNGRDGFGSGSSVGGGSSGGSNADGSAGGGGSTGHGSA